MTFMVRKLDDAQSAVEIGITSGAVRVTVTEPIAYLRHFWGELGRLLEETEAAREPAADALADPGHQPEEASLLDAERF